jgi:quinol monooxygenase YgiN
MATNEEANMQMTSFTPDDLNSGFVVAITIEAKPGEADRIAAIAQDLVAPTMAEPGVKLFLPYRSPTNPSLFFIFELYVNEAGWEAHQATEHFAEAVKELLPRVIRRERIPFVPFVVGAR